jgi:hypothetical protein
LRRGQQLGQAKIKNLGLPRFCHEYVCRLDVAVDNPLRMGGSQAGGNLRG